METTYRPTTLGELVEAGYRHRSVRDEMRENLLAMLARKESPSLTTPQGAGALAVGREAGFSFGGRF